jgi:hypothetical protein
VAFGARVNAHELLVVNVNASEKAVRAAAYVIQLDWLATSRYRANDDGCCGGGCDDEAVMALK